MPDITMCSGINKETKEECPMRDTCYRHTAKPNEYWQSYFLTAPFIKEPDGTSCEHFFTRYARIKT